MRTCIFLALLLPLQLRAETPPNEIPLFEGADKTGAQVDADRQFLSDIDKTAGGRPAAIERLLDTGWKAIQTHDTSTAIKRFNQVYLLAPHDYRAYWGLGTASALRGDIERAERLFRTGLAYNRADVRFLSDAGFALQQSALAAAQQKNIDPRPKLTEAKNLYLEAGRLAPTASLPQARLAVILFFEGDCVGALHAAAQSQKNGGDGLDPNFLRDLRKQCRG